MVMNETGQYLVDAIIFDLDGVLTDTAEYHFRAWQRLADEAGIPFTRADNEKLRGVSRQKSLEIILSLDNRSVPDDQFLEMMDRKNEYYQKMLENLTPDDLLPGVDQLLTEIREAGLKIAVASASRNAKTVVSQLGLQDRIDALADGYSPGRPKPAPDLFLHAAKLLDLPPARCIVVEDAEAGITGGIAAGMVTLGIGPEGRVGQADQVLPSLDGVHLSDLTYAATWRVSDPVFAPSHQHHLETILAQGNGYLGTRGAFEEQYAGDRAGTLIHGLWDDVPLLFTELVSAPDWTAVEITVNGYNFDMSDQGISNYARWLDLRTGVLHRRLRWQPAGESSAVDIYFERIPSLADPHLAALKVRVQPLSEGMTITVRSSLKAYVENQGFLREGVTHWDILSQHADADEMSLKVCTRHTRETLGMSGRLATNLSTVTREAEYYSGIPSIALTATVEAGTTFAVEKFVSIYTTRDVEDPVDAARRMTPAARDTGYEALRKSSDRAWKDFWVDSDVIIEGDDEAQLALRHALFQLRAAAPATDERVSIGPKGLSGFGYRGHVFWDTEIFMLPFFIYTQPELARNLLMYRWHTLDGARRNAESQGFPGARYAWESAATGDEVTPIWIPSLTSRDSPAIRIWTGDIELHITTDVAYGLWQYWQVTGDDVFMQQVGAPIILETALYWGERVEAEEGQYVIRDVMGPDEYHEHVDNNVYTNRMVKWHLETALALREWLYEVAPERAIELDQRLGLTLDEATGAERHLMLGQNRIQHWRDVCEKLVILHDEDSGLMEQFEGFFNLEELDWAEYENRTASLQSLLGLQAANLVQVVKQPDVILLLCLLRDQYDATTWQANWDYYAPRTDHRYGSSLGPAIHAWAACEVDQAEEAYEYFMLGARADLKDIRGNTGDGFHAASAGGLWQAIAFGFAGLRVKENNFTLRPRLTGHWTRLSFKFYLNGEQRVVDLRANGGSV
jgi:beta-phosphoglucomutase